MAKTYQRFEDARETRRATLSLIEGLTQEQSEYRPGPKRWSAGEVVDHLLKVDAIVVREADVALKQRRWGMIFVYRSFADVEPSVPWVLRPLLPFVEVPMGMAGTLVPPPVRRFLTGNRRVKGQAPDLLWPRFGRDVETLREELEGTFVDLEKQQKDHPGVDLGRLFYFNPIVGLTTIAGLYAFIRGHEKRHQEQLREVLEDPGLPARAS